MKLRGILTALGILIYAMSLIGCSGGGGGGTAGGYYMGGANPTNPTSPTNPTTPTNPVTPSSSSVTIKGRLVDLNGNPIVGAEVLNKGVNNEVIKTDANGFFEIELTAVANSTFEINFRKGDYTITPMQVEVNAAMKPIYKSAVLAYLPLTKATGSMVTTLHLQHYLSFYNLGNPALSSDGKYMYFYDSYYINKLNLETLEFINITPSSLANATSDIVLSKNDDTLYTFSSNGLFKITGVKNAQSPDDVTATQITNSADISPTYAGISGNGVSLSGGSMILSPDEDRLYVYGNTSGYICMITGLKTAATPTGTMVYVLAGKEPIPNPPALYTNFADGPAQAAIFNNKYSYGNKLAISPNGDKLYVADNGNYRIRRISGVNNALTNPSGVTVSTIAGGGTEDTGTVQGNQAYINYPSGIALSSDGNSLYITEEQGCKIKKITNLNNASNSSETTVTTFAGKWLNVAMDGTGSEAGFVYPRSLVINDNEIYVFDAFRYSHTIIRKIIGYTP